MLTEISPPDRPAPVSMLSVTLDLSHLQSLPERLRWSRNHAGFSSASDAARARGWTVSTYLGHENGGRVPDLETVKRYARAYRVRWQWLLDGEGAPLQAAPVVTTRGGEISVGSVPIVGVLAPGGHVIVPKGTTHVIDRAPAPPDCADDTVALVNHGKFMLPGLEDGGLVYFRQSEAPPEEHIGRLCVLELEDGSRLVGRAFRGRAMGLFDVLTGSDERRLDCPVVRAMPVEWIKVA